MEDNAHIVIHGFMRNKLSLSGNELMIYAIIYGFSQDGESKFFGSRQYLADWCGCTVRSVQTILNNLTDKGLLKKYEEWSNGVKICQYTAVTDFRGSEKISLGGSEKISLYNIDTDNIENGISSKEDIRQNADYIPTTTDVLENKPLTLPQTPSLPPKDEDEFEGHSYTAKDFLGSARKRRSVESPKKESMFDKCAKEIREYTDDEKLRKALFDYLPLRLAMKDKPLVGVNQFKGILNALNRLPGNKVAIVEQSIEHGWASMYELKSTTQFQKNGSTVKPAFVGTSKLDAKEEYADETF